MSNVFSLMKVAVQVARDSTLTDLLASGGAIVSQVNDNKEFQIGYRIGPSDAEFTVPYSTVITNVYRWMLFADTPVQYRRALSDAKVTLAAGNTASVNVGAPSPWQSFVGGTEKIPGLYLSPASGATATANVLVILVGDPTNAY